MRAERQRRAAKIVGILAVKERERDSDRAARREQLMKKVRFAEAIEGLKDAAGGGVGGGDGAFERERAFERRFWGGGEGIC